MTKSILQKVDESTHVPKNKFVTYPPFPKAIKIEITSYCNYKCSYCAVTKSLRPKGNINKEFLFRILKEAKSVGVEEIGMFLLGESFLVKALPEYIEYAKKIAKIPYVFITTNGSLCSLDKLVPVIDAGLDSLKFSVNAASRSRYKKMHGVDAFDKVIGNIKALDGYRKKNNITTLRVSISSIFNEKYKKELEDFRNSISPYIDDFYYLPLYNQAGFVINKKQKNRVVGNPGRLDNMVKSVPCWALFNAAKITWDGWLTACCFDHDKTFEIADLNKVSLLEAWNHPKFGNLRNCHLNNDVCNSPCAKCLGYSTFFSKIGKKWEDFKEKIKTS